MENNDYIQNIADRYIYQVTKHLLLKNRSDIEDELRSLISDMLDERTKSSTATKDDIDSVLLELGDPSELSDRYKDNSRCLIGVGIYSQYLVVIKIVLLSVAFAMLVVSTLEILTETDHLWYQFILNWLGNTVTGILMAFAWVTLIFASLEKQGVNLKKVMPHWNVASLPPLPDTHLTINRWESIVSLIFTVLVTCLFVFTPQLMGAFVFSEGLKAIPIFDLNTLKQILPLFLICFGLGVIKYIFQMIEGKYTKRLVIFSVINDIISLILSIIIFTRFHIWNSDFVLEIKNLVNLGLDISLERIWYLFTNNFIFLIIIAFIIECGTMIYKSLKYNLINL